jgi:hypothetical protein
VRGRVRRTEPLQRECASESDQARRFTAAGFNERARFLAEFDRRLKGKVNLGTIDWIWDEYVQHSTGGRNYSRNYRPTDPDHLREFSTGNYGSFDLAEWLERLRPLKVRGSARD